MTRSKGSYFSRNCRVCQYCQQGHMDFHKTLLTTKHFDMNGPTVQRVWKEFKPEIQGTVIPYTTVMQHVRRHLIPAYELLKERSIVREYHENKKVVTEEQLQEVLAGQPEIVGSKSRSEQALDDYIAKFHRLVDDDKIQITAQGGLQAIKIRADIDKANRDRKVDVFKAFAARGRGEVSDA